MSAPEFKPDGQRVNGMFSSIAARYDLANSVLSFGIHHGWRRRLLSLVESNPRAVVLDLCTGTGDLLPLLRRRFGSVVGADFCRPMLMQGVRKELVRSGAGAGLVQADGLRLPFADRSFDIVTVAFGVRNFEDLERGLSEIYRVLKPGGDALILEFGQPTIPLWSSLFSAYSRWVMPSIGAMLTGNRHAYTYLPQTARNFPCREEFCARLRRAGFDRATFRSLSGGVAYAYRASRVTAEPNVER